jgi:hypothetical protein
MSNRLPILAAEIRRAHAEAEETAKTAAERAIAAGHGLIEAKGLVQHGEWLPFLAEAGIPRRTARRYMAIAASDLELATVANLGLAGAEHFLSLRKQMMATLGKTDVASALRVGGLLGEMAEMLGAELREPEADSDLAKALAMQTEVDELQVECDRMSARLDGADFADLAQIVMRARRIETRLGEIRLNAEREVSRLGKELYASTGMAR